jgi:hypothetical protein
VEHFRFKLGRTLPPDLAYLVTAEWVPWEQLRLRHQGDQDRKLVALFKAYQHIHLRLPVTQLSETPIPAGSERCRMCGTCCSTMRPGVVSARTFRTWDGKLVADFFHTAGRGVYPTYICWVFAGERLRMCPLLLYNVASEKPFCSVHHLGPSQRHPACSTYRANPPLCRATAMSLEW